MFDTRTDGNIISITINPIDAASATAMSLTASSSGAVQVKTIPLISVEEVDAAVKKSLIYRPPGS